jgi:hypothetical protein
MLNYKMHIFFWIIYIILTLAFIIIKIIQIKDDISIYFESV